MVTNNYATTAATSNYDASVLNTATLDAREIKSNIAISQVYCTTPSITISDEITSYVRSQLENKSEPKKEEESKKMDNKIFNFDFGPLKSDNVRMSICMALPLRIGMAIMQHGIRQMRVL